MKHLILILLGLALTACGGGGRAVQSSALLEAAEKNRYEELNQEIARSAAFGAATVDDLEYHLGAGDVIDITVFQVEELNTKVRVNGRGQVILPLLGTVDVGGLSVAQVEQELTRRLAEDYLRDPQVGLFIDEYRSQQISVMGAVENPNVYNVRQARTIFDMLSLAGGLADEASDKIIVKTVQSDPETGQDTQLDLILSVSALLEGAEAASNLRLRGGDSILVPEAGVVYVEGAVNKPGSYQMEGETNVLKAIAMAGGAKWESKESKIQVIREIAGEPVTVDVNLNAVRNQRGDDVVLKDGDIVVVGYSAIQRSVAAFFRTAGSFFGFGYNINN